VFEAWEEKQAREEKRREERRAMVGKGKAAVTHGFDMGDIGGKGKGKGKGKETVVPDKHEDSEAEGGEDANEGSSAGQRNGKEALGSLVVFACRHIYHQSCLEALQEKEGWTATHEPGREREFRCPVDG
jgi:hypothetical protein